MTSMLFLCFILCFSISVAQNPFPDRTDNQFLSECLKVSNEHRARHQSPPVRLDPKAISYAKSRCRQISQDKSLSHGHAGLHGYGENLNFMTGFGIESCKTAINLWYNQVENYDYNKPGFSKETSEFTALVWKSTTRMGCARCGRKAGNWYETYVVCNYSPPGNIMDKYQDNVFLPKSKAKH